MKRGHVPIRTCRGCGRKAPRRELLRLILQAGTLTEGEKHETPGKGIYCCRTDECRTEIVRRYAKRRNKTHLQR